MNISGAIAFLEKVKVKNGDIPIYKRESGGQGSAWEYLELEERDVRVKKDLDDWGEQIPVCLVIE